MIREIVRAGIHRHLLGAAVLLGVAWSAEAHAKNSIADADVREAKLLMEQKRYSDACPKIAESHRREPTGEKIFELGRCHYEQGRIATAYYELREAMDIARRDGRHDRLRPAKAMLEDIETKLPKLNMTVALKVSSLPGFELKRDGMVVRPQEWGTDIPADPGVHTIVASAPGYEPMLTTIELQPDGSIGTVSVTNLEPVGAKDPKPALKLAPKAMRPEAEQPKSSSAIQRTAGLIMGGVGVGAIGAGAVLSLQASSVQADSDAHCRGSVCSPEGREMRKSAETLGTASTLMLIGGGVATAGGLMLFLTAPTTSQEKAAKGPGITQVGVGPTGGFVTGQW
jgi:hypothetical protein